MQITELLAAPKTNSPLTHIEDMLVDETHAQCAYKIVSGIPIFTPSSHETGAVDSNLTKMLDSARSENCAVAIEKYSRARDYLVDERRSRYLDIINLQPNDTVLEIGASMGQHSRLIAARCNHLETLEVVQQQAQFAKFWCDESEISNINISVGGSDGYLPYKSNSFDRVVMNYVLEWSASRASSPPSQYHAHFLAECFRVLKPGGTIFVSTKNRFSIRLLLGGLDEHLNLRFGSALPRWISSIFTRYRNSTGMNGYLHSRKAIERLFTEAKFTNLQPYLLLPDARIPEVAEAFDSEGIDSIAATGYWDKCSKKEILFSWLPFSIQKNIAPSHAYTAIKST